MNCMLYISLTLLLLCIVDAQSATTSPPVKCGKNQVYTTCGSACPATCSDLLYPVPKPIKPCILLCRSGCSCKEGYYLTNDKTCVAPDQCCGKNEKYQTCGSDCIEICGRKPIKCSTKCVSGCFCGCSDYVRQNNRTGSRCIPRSQCPKISNANK